MDKMYDVLVPFKYKDKVEAEEAMRRISDKTGFSCQLVEYTGKGLWVNEKKKPKYEVCPECKTELMECNSCGNYTCVHCGWSDNE